MGPYADSDYDRDFNLLYVFVNPTEEVKSGFAKSRLDENPMLRTNLAIYDIETDRLAHFFEIGNGKLIHEIYYEKDYLPEKKKMLFNKEDRHIFNNYEIEERKKADVLLMLAWDRKLKQFEFWKSTRQGDKKEMLTSFTEEEKVVWQIDVFNKKVIFIRKLQNEVKVQSFDWLVYSG